jgi:hypothetical protein
MSERVTAESYERIARAFLETNRDRPRGALYLSLKAGRGEGWDNRKYGDGAPRWFVYWQADELDAALAAAGFRVLDAWSETTAGDAWWMRLAAPVGA